MARGVHSEFNMCFAVLAGLFLAGTAGLMARHDVPPPLVTVTILVQAEQPLHPPVYEAMRMEVDQIYEGTAVSTEWRNYRTGETTPVMTRAVVVRMRGDCTANGLYGMENLKTHSPLGFTHSVDGHLLPFVEVLCDKVRALAMYRRANEPREPAWMFGRALGRVLAHEMFHVLAETSSHAEEGLLRAHLSGSELTCPYLGLDRKSVKKLSVAISRRHLPPVSQPTERAGF